jgi:hypothetical protein
MQSEILVNENEITILRELYIASSELFTAREHDEYAEIIGGFDEAYQQWEDKMKKAIWWYRRGQGGDS